MENSRVKKAVIFYFCALIVSIVFFNSSGGSTVMYIGYVGSIFLLFAYCLPYMKKLNAVLFMWGVFILFSGVFAIVNHYDHVFVSIQSIGLNVNIFVPLMYSAIISVLIRRKMTSRQIESILKAIMMISLVIIAVTLVLNLDSLGKLFSSSYNVYLVAIRGFFPNKNMLGNFAAFACVISVYLFAVKKSRFGFVSMAALIVFTVFTFSRAALLFVAVFVTAYFLLSFRTPGGEKGRMARRFRSLVLAVLILIALACVFSADVREFAFNRILRIQTGDAGRSNIQEYVRPIIERSTVTDVLFGIGVSELEYLVPYDLHNTYLTTYVVGGVTKLTLFFAGILISFFSILRQYQKPIIKFCMSCLVAYLAFCFFETVVFFELGLFNFELLFIIIIIPLSLKHEEDDPDELSQTVLNENEK